MQQAFTCVAELQAEHIPALEALLNDIHQEDVEHNSIIPFRQIRSIHFARLLILPEVKKQDGTRKYPPYLVMSTNYDGSLQNHLREIREVCGENFDRLFGYCKDYPSSPASPEQQLDFLTSHSNYRAYFYRGSWSQSVEHIQEQDKNRQMAEAYLDESLISGSHSANELKTGIRECLSEEGVSLGYQESKQPQLGFWDYLQIVLVCLLCLVLVLPFALILLIHEFLDSEQPERYSKANEIASLAQREDFIVQNQLSHLVEVKPGPFRLFTLKLVLHGVNWAAKYIYNRGHLANISSIHFARWVLIDKGRRLLFFSNFDGSWESYLGDFVDKAAVGLTAVWSNTLGFPATRLLVFKGARDEQRFKAWARRQQIFTQVWYSAYKDLTVSNILNNQEIQEGLQTPMDPRTLSEFLAKY